MNKFLKDIKELYNNLKHVQVQEKRRSNIQDTRPT